MEIRITNIPPKIIEHLRIAEILRSGYIALSGFRISLIIGDKFFIVLFFVHDSFLFHPGKL
jgi:hypothetical protein